MAYLVIKVKSFEREEITMKGLLTMLLVFLCVFIMFKDAYSNLDTGLVAFYPFNGNANDESGNGNNGTAHGAILTTDRFGNENSAYNFDGIDDFIETSDLDPWYDFTVTGWFKTNENNKYMRIIDKDGGYYIDHWSVTVNTNGMVFTGYKQGSNASTDLWSDEILNDNQWHFFVSKQVNNEYFFYIDGKLDTSAFVPSFTFNNDVKIYVGYSASNQAVVNYYKGAIDDIRIFHRSLSELEIDSLYHEGGWPYRDRIQKAAEWLISTQHADGSFSGQSYDSAPDFEYTSLITFALIDAGFSFSDECVQKAIDWILTQENNDGSWSSGNIGDTYFGLLMEMVINKDLNKTRNWLINKQLLDGSFIEGSVNDKNRSILSPILGLLLSGFNKNDPVIRKAIEYLVNNQGGDGSWISHNWGPDSQGNAKIIYMLRLYGIPLNDPIIQKGIENIRNQQHDDGGFGPINPSHPGGVGEVINLLLASGIPKNDPLITRALDYLLVSQNENGSWPDPWASSQAQCQTIYPLISLCIMTGQPAPFGKIESYFWQVTHLSNYTEYFNVDVFSDDQWMRTDNSVSVNLIDSCLHIGADGDYDDFANKSICLPLPFVIETRMRLVSGGNNYRLPWLFLRYGNGTNDCIVITYLPTDPFGWAFAPASSPWPQHVFTNAPPSENVWWSVRARINSDGGQLYAKSDNDSTFTFVLSNTWTIPNEVIGLSFTQPWDAVCDIDFVKVDSVGAEITAVIQYAILPHKFVLSQNHPNPFNPITYINYAIPKKVHLRLEVYDLQGRLVEVLVDGTKEPGYYSMSWNAASLPSGIYLYKLIAGEFTEIKKCLLIK